METVATFIGWVVLVAAAFTTYALVWRGIGGLAWRLIPADWKATQRTYVPGRGFLFTRRYLLLTFTLGGPLGWGMLPTALRAQRAKRRALARAEGVEVA